MKGSISGIFLRMETDLDDGVTGGRGQGGERFEADPVGIKEESGFERLQDRQG